MSQTLQIMEIGEQIAYLEDQLTKWKEDYICLENLKDYEIKQLQEHHKKVCGDFTFIHRTLEEKIKELQADIEIIKADRDQRLARLSKGALKKTAVLEEQIAVLEEQIADLKDYVLKVSKFLHNNYVKPDKSACKERDMLLIKELKLFEKWRLSE